MTATRQIRPKGLPSIATVVVEAVSFKCHGCGKADTIPKSAALIVCRCGRRYRIPTSAKVPQYRPNDLPS